MANKLNCYIDVLKLQGAHRMRLKNKAGEPTDCIVIALPSSRIRFGKKGGANLALSLVPNKNGPDDFDNTHWICEPSTKEERESIDPPKLPILGNAREYDNGPRPAPQRTTVVTAAAQGEEMAATDDDEIPF